MTHHIVQTIPNEILEMIFDDCCDTNLFSVVNGIIQSSLEDIPALALSSVCLRWRRVGLSLSRIWSRISLEYRGKPPLSLLKGNLPFNSQKDHWLEWLSTILTTFISRSRQQPLILSICLDGLPVPDTLGVETWYSYVYGPVFILCREYQRWSNFTSRMRWPVGVGELFIAINPPLHVGAFPILVDLDVPFDAGLNFFTIRAPNLQRLKLSPPPGIDLSVGRTLSKLTALRSLDVDDLVIHRHLRVFLLPKSVSPTACPGIEVLNVRHHDNDTVDSIFPFLSLPSLKTLYLDCGREFVERRHSWSSFKHFRAFVQRSSFPLTTFCIKCVALSDSQLIDLLYHIPTLLDLAVMDPIIKDGENGQKLIPITGIFLQCLHVGTDSLLHPATPLVPRLRCLTLHVGECFFAATEALDLVQSRWAHGSQFGVDCLQSLTILFRGRTDVPEAYDALNGIEKGGTKITVLCSNSATEYLPMRPEYQ